MMFHHNSLRMCVVAVLLMVGTASEENQEALKARQVASQTPLLPSNAGGLLGNIIPTILPIILILGLGAFLLPAVGILLFGSTGGLGGMFDSYGKKRSFNLKGNPIFNTEKMIELLQTVTKAIEEVSKEN